jgi:restriction system protein
MTASGHLDPDWEQILAESRFTGRQAELSLLRRELVEGQNRIVWIQGAFGTGKTALAMFFGHVHQSFFKAGVYHVHANAIQELSRSVDAHVSHPISPYLLILDDLELREPVELGREISDVARSRPSARLVCISRRTHPNSRHEVINLGGLEQGDIEELFAKLLTGYRLDPVLARAMQGNALVAEEVARAVRSGQGNPRMILQWLRNFELTGLVDPNGAPLQSGSQQDRIIADVRSVSDKLLERVHADPSMMYDLPSRRFEELIAELLQRLGYQVELTPASRDGGKDIFAAKKDDLGSFLYLVECKRHAPHHKVGVELIRQLYGVVQAERATAGILATTSFFTEPAREFQRQVAHQMSLQDFFGLQKWLDAAFRARR